MGCSPIKADRELGLDRRETGRTLSDGNVDRLKENHLQYERNKVMRPLVQRLSDRAAPRSYASENKN